MGNVKHSSGYKGNLAMLTTSTNLKSYWLISSLWKGASSSDYEVSSTLDLEANFGY